MVLSVFSYLSICIYLVGFVYLVVNIFINPNFDKSLLRRLTLIALILHGLVAANMLFVGDGLDLSLFVVFVLIAFSTNTFVFLGGRKKPLHSMYLALFPISAVCLGLAVTYPSTKSVSAVSVFLQSHILISILAYSLLAIAALHAILTGYQNWQLKAKKQNLMMRTFPPLQTMEDFLFELIWAGEIFLTLSLITGFLFYDDMFDQKLLHKATLSMVAWAVYAILLWGRHSRGWRGIKAIGWSWVGFTAILMGYIGSKIVLEFILI
jgi:ABC-type uncharacterized transport system permease subunit